MIPPTRWIFSLGTACILGAAMGFYSPISLAEEELSRDTPTPLPTGPKSALCPVSREFESRLRATYEQASPAVVQMLWTDGKNASDGSTGVVITEDGLILLKYVPPQSKLNVRLADGRSASATVLGGSHEWNLALAKFTGAGPWPHAPLQTTMGTQRGKPFLTLTYPIADTPKPALQGPLLQLGKVQLAARGFWFMTTDFVLGNLNSAVAFDIDGEVIGMQSAAYHSGPSTYFTSCELIAALLNDLVKGKDLDPLRLGSLSTSANETANHPAIKETETSSEEIERKCVQASVRIHTKGHNFSGTLISVDGLIATCAHHLLPPGTSVTVSLPDGRDVSAKIAGSSFPCDAGFVRITQPGTYPFVETGASTSLSVGDGCLVLGFGPVDESVRQPSVRKARVVDSPEGRWSYRLYTDAKLVGGDSGGGVFDRAGRLVGFNSEIFPFSAHPRVELFLKHQEELQAQPLPATASEGAITDGLPEKLKAKIDTSVVQVRDGTKIVSLGIIVSSDGRIVTKASALPSSPTCRLSDGRVFVATILKVVRAHDLAVLKIEATGLSAELFSTSPEETAVGNMVAVTDGSAQPIWGCISHPTRSIGPEAGWLRARFEETPKGLQVTELLDFTNSPASSSIFASYGPQPLQKLDILRSVDGHPTPNLDSLSKILDVSGPTSFAVAGDPVRLVVQRAGRDLDFGLILGPPSWPRMASESPRNSGFQAIFHAMVDRQSNVCGGPVRDREGRAVGLAIAWRGPGWILVLPSSVVRSTALE